MIIMKQNISSLIAACLIGSAGAASAATTTVNVNFHQPATLDITSQRLTTGLFKTPTPYYDSLDMNLGSGLALSITATAFKNGKTNKPLGDRVVYYSQVGAPGQAGLGVTSVTRWTGPLGTQYVLDNGRDGSIDIDSHASLDNGHDALILSFNQKVTMNSLTLFHMDTDDRATLRVLDGGSSASKNIQCASCLPTDHYKTDLGFIGTSFILQANDKTWRRLSLDTTEFRLAGLDVSFTPAVPEPETYAMLLAGLALVSAVAHRRKQQTH